MMRAEWEPQDMVLVVWPHPQTDWLDVIESAERTYLYMVRAISRYTTTLIVIQNELHLNHVTALLSQHALDTQNLRFIICPYNDTWVRDYGPISVGRMNKTILYHFMFNGWGNKFASKLDNALSAHLNDASVFNSPYEQIPFVLEGGSVESNGQGTLLTTKSCINNPNRNPDMSEQDIDDALKLYLGAKTILYLESSMLMGDDTDGHIDNIARFLSPTTIAYISTEDTSDPHYTVFQHLKSELAALRDPNGNAYSLVPLHIPAPIYHEGERLPASYLNFLITNQGILVPQFDDPMDIKALATMKSYFPTHHIHGIDSTVLLHQGGNIHCATMQIHN